MDEDVVLVDAQGQVKRGLNNAILTRPKLQAHQLGLLHSAVSVLLFDDDKLLLQRRADTKYHSAGLWTNTSCTHPRVDEAPLKSAKRCLTYEMGVTCSLREVHSFVYRVQVSPELLEHEYDRVFVGDWDGTPVPNPQEVSEWRWASITDLLQEIEGQPDHFTEWLKLCLPEVLLSSGR